MNRDELIEIGARALFDEGEEGPSVEAEERREGCRTLAEEVIDAVEPLIRADERERTVAREADKHIATVEWNRQAVLADLRAKVAALQAEYEAAPDVEHAYYALRDVLALLDGSSE